VAEMKYVCHEAFIGQVYGCSNKVHGVLNNHTMGGHRTHI